MNRAAFFDEVRSSLFHDRMSQPQVDGCEALLTAMEAARWPSGWAAYGLATAKWETAHTMRPIEEYGKGKGRAYGKPDPTTGQIYYGRGYVQLTWGYNYKKAGDKLGADLMRRPELALQPDIAAKIMIAGMSEGWFTGKKLGDYIGPVRKDYVGARKIINGTDHDDDIAAIARKFEVALRASGWGDAPVIAPKPTVITSPASAVTTPRPDDPGPRTAPQPQPGFWSRFWSALKRRAS